jgi:hypothetical protein
VCLWEFSWNFWDFRTFFVALLIYLGISRFIFAQENISKKRKIIPFLPGRARMPDPYPPGPTIKPTRGPSGPLAPGAADPKAATVANLGVRAEAGRQALACAPIKGGSRAPPHALDGTSAATLYRPCAEPPAGAPSHRRPFAVSPSPQENRHRHELSHATPKPMHLFPAPEVRWSAAHTRTRVGHPSSACRRFPVVSVRLPRW